LIQCSPVAEDAHDAAHPIESVETRRENNDAGSDVREECDLIGGDEPGAEGTVPRFRLLQDIDVEERSRESHGSAAGFRDQDILPSAHKRSFPR